MPLHTTPLKRKRFNPLGVILMLSLGAFLAACTDKTKTPVDKPQVAAVVNGTEIMQREVDLIYKRIEVPGTPAPIATAQRRAILADLVRTELLAQQAVAEKLDKASDLEVDAQLARRQSLARLTEHRILEGVSPLPPDVLKKLVEANPIAFAQRKALVLDEMALEKADKPEDGTKGDKGDKAKADAERAKAEAALSGKPVALEKYYLQAGAFEDPSEADNLKARLALMGVEASVQKVELPEKGTVHRVRVGPYLGSDDMNKARQQLSSNGINAAIVKIKPKEPKPAPTAQ